MEQHTPEWPSRSTLRERPQIQAAKSDLAQNHSRNQTRHMVSWAGLGVSLQCSLWVPSNPGCSVVLCLQCGTAQNQHWKNHAAPWLLEMLLLAAVILWYRSCEGLGRKSILPLCCGDCTVNFHRLVCTEVRDSQLQHSCNCCHSSGLFK